MIVTVLAVLFLIFLLATAVFGTRLMQRKSAAEKSDSDKCSLCGSAFPKKDLIVRQVGDYKLLRFCRTCIAKLASDAGLTN